MTSEYILFQFFGLLCLTMSLMVISAKNPVHSVFYLVLVFLNAAGLFMILGVEFLAIMFIIVYVGAIAILFLFIVMMLNIKLVELHENILRYLPMGTLMAMVFFYEMYLLMNEDVLSFIQGPHNYNQMVSWDYHMMHYTHLELLGLHVYTLYFALFFIASIILLVAMVGAIVLTLHSQVNVKSQDVFKQSSSHFSKSLILKS